MPPKDDQRGRDGPQPQPDPEAAAQLWRPQRLEVAGPPRQHAGGPARVHRQAGATDLPRPIVQPPDPCGFAPHLGISHQPGMSQPGNEQAGRPAALHPVFGKPGGAGALRQPLNGGAGLFERTRQPQQREPDPESRLGFQRGERGAGPRRSTVLGAREHLVQEVPQEVQRQDAETPGGQERIQHRQQKDPDLFWTDGAQFGGSSQPRRVASETVGGRVRRQLKPIQKIVAERHLETLLRAVVPQWNLYQVNIKHPKVSTCKLQQESYLAEKKPCAFVNYASENAAVESRLETKAL